MKYIEENSRIWDSRSANNDIWSIPVTSEMIKQAKEGKWSIVLTPEKPVPASWFPDQIHDKKSYAWQAAEDSRAPYLRL